MEASDSVGRTNFISCFEESCSENGGIKFKCKIENCLRSYTDKSAAIRHLRLNHKDVFVEIQRKKIEKPAETFEMDRIFELRVKVCPNDILKACVELVTVHGLPFSVVDYPAFRKMLNPYLIALKLKGIDLVINRQNIKQYIEEKAIDLKKMIMKQVRGKAVSVMIDIATRYNRSILGINIAYMHEGKVIIRTIGMQILRFTHTAANLVKVIKKHLSDHFIRLDQVISFTTDNGKNMIKAAALIDKEYMEECFGEGDEEFIDDDIFDGNYYDDLLLGISENFSGSNGSNMIYNLPCAAHCVHLVIKHSIEASPSIKNIVEKCKKLAKKLRTPTLRGILYDFQQKMAIVNVETRWNSIYSMVCIDFCCML